MHDHRMIEAGEGLVVNNDTPPPSGSTSSALAKLAAAKARIALLAKRIEPKTLYVRRDLLNADEFIAWAKSQGFKTTTPADKLHVTVAYSKEPVDWSAAGDSFDTIIDPAIEGAVSGERSVAPLGDGGAVVLKFANYELESRWREFIDAGASWDFEGYQPHVTISWNAADVDLSKVEPFAGPLHFGPEVFEQVDEDWKTSHVEKADKRNCWVAESLKALSKVLKR